MIKNQILEPIINNTEIFYQEKQFKKPQKCLVESIFLGGLALRSIPWSSQSKTQKSNQQIKVLGMTKTQTLAARSNKNWCG